MLVQYTPVSALDEASKNRLRASCGYWLQGANEAEPTGFVFFEGKYFKTEDVRRLASPPKSNRLLQE